MKTVFKIKDFINYNRLSATIESKIYNTIYLYLACQYRLKEKLKLFQLHLTFILYLIFYTQFFFRFTMTS